MQFFMSEDRMEEQPPALGVETVTTSIIQYLSFSSFLHHCRAPFSCLRLEDLTTVTELSCFTPSATVQLQSSLLHSTSGSIYTQSLSQLTCASSLKCTNIMHPAQHACFIFVQPSYNHDT
ncbi:Hypothetical predicted protein [Octopus vulgaris]|uniref:Uncharacterized protein n=1 Tax=Octopus vulgaris TaxID=6645 RepID=A0AA36FKM2_OCTVU|nr:Hypothetical predicted protein [Octopus vulgaris]